MKTKRVKFLYSVIILFSYPFVCLFSQNLVPNPSFETVTSCPTNTSDACINLATPWDKPSGSSTTPDLFDPCNSGGVPCTDSLGAPVNFAGIANPFHGNRYAGIMTYYATPNLREYIQAQLTSSLAAGADYCVSMRVIRGSRSGWATNNLGMYLSIGAVSQPSAAPITVTPQFKSTAIIKDSANWTIISGNYTATGGENYITIGNFNDDNSTQKYNYGFSSGCVIAYQSAYYFIDSVFVGTCSAPPPTATFTASSSNICTGDCITFTDMSTNGPTSWNWNFPGGTPSSYSGENPPSVCFTGPGSYNISLIVSNAYGSGTAAALIQVNSPPAASISGNSTVCAGETSYLTASPTGLSYLWNTGATIQTISVSPDSSFTYSAIVTSGNCSDTAYFPVTVNPLPVAFVSGNPIICTGDTAILTAGGGVSYLWDTGETGSVISVFPGATYSYPVTVTDANGCTDTASVTVTVISEVIASVSGSTTVCQGQSTILTASGGSGYLWNDNSTTASITVSLVTTTSFSVTVTAGTCSDSTTVTVTVLPSFQTEAGSDISINYGDSAVLNVTTAGGTAPFSYIWSTGETIESVSVSPESDRKYSITVSDATGCTASDSLLVTVIPCKMNLFIPTAFSPNGDNNNDVLMVRGVTDECVQYFKLSIYNRWGQKIWETQDPAAGWDGTWKGKMMDTGVFVYCLWIKWNDWKEDVIKGNITLVK
ncbi:MAG: gliding motility-associated C-terminal domain-containing protein [Bacteroidetes bacterium]|nr:gliding motility-associated C-terminal domain-containing protein [Bacteroidota bacterium]